MKRTTKRGWALALVLGTLAGTIRADDGKAPTTSEEITRAMEAASRPGPEHEKLKPLAGTWSYTCKMWMEPGGEPIETTGVIEREWILGGRFLSEKVRGTGFDGQPGFEAFGLLGYDNNLKKYTQTFACSMGTGTSTGVGVATKSGEFTFKTECACPLAEEKVKGRDVVRIVNDNKIVTESYQTIAGKEVKMMEIVAVREK